MSRPHPNADLNSTSARWPSSDSGLEQTLHATAIPLQRLENGLKQSRLNHHPDTAIQDGLNHSGAVDEDDYADKHIYTTLPVDQPHTRTRRMTQRKLYPIHVFFITVNATLGIGLYWRGGQILEVGGPLAVILSFLLLGILAWAVMQCITEMLCIWPVPSALGVFVREFIDTELGIVVGVAYWLTYSTSFATLIAASAGEIHFWTNNTGLDAGVLYLLVPLILVIINSFGVQIYGGIEVLTGIIKSVFFVIIILATIVFANMYSGPSSGNPSNWDDLTAFDGKAADSWAAALFICLSTATFAYVGVEVPAACALETRATRSRRPASKTTQEAPGPASIGRSLKVSTKWVPVLACTFYTLGGILSSLSIDRTHPSLPRPGWVDYSDVKSSSDDETTSLYVLIAKINHSEKLASAFNVFLVFTALSCANTNLYVASRTLFGLTNQIDGGRGQLWYHRVLAWVGRTNRHRVPIRAMAVSAFAFFWIPFLQLIGQQREGSDQSAQDGDAEVSQQDARIGANTFIGTLSEIGSVGVLIVWACQCWAFIRFYRCINQHKMELKAQDVPHVRRWDDDHEHDYPYRGHGQPFLAYLALAGCLVILLVANGASLWKDLTRDRFAQPFISSYGVIIIFLGLWVALKLVRGAKWSLVDLSDPDIAIEIIRGLHQSSFAGLQDDGSTEGDIHHKEDSTSEGHFLRRILPVSVGGYLGKTFH